MIDIQKIAEQAGIEFQEHRGITGRGRVITCGSQPLERLERAFAMYREALIAELVAGSGEPVGFWAGNPDIDPQPCYTADQLAGTVLRERERCAKVCDQRQLFGNTDERWSAKECAAEIRGQRDEEMEPHDQNWRHGEEV